MSADRDRDDVVLPPRPATAESDYDPNGKSPDEIEEDISETRAELGVILDELERKLAPRHLLERGVDMLKDSMSGDGSSKIGETLRGNPVPLALIGIGIGWILMSSTGAGRGRLGEYGGALRERISDAAQNIRERAGELAEQVREKVPGMAGSSGSGSPTGPYPTESAGYAYARQKSGDAMDKAQGTMAAARDTVQDTMRRAQDAGSAAWERASDYAGQAGEQLYQARDRFTELVEEHPIAVGALGFLAGTLIALALPRTEIEERLVEPVGEQIRGQAASVGREAVDRAQQVAGRTVDAAVGAVKEAVNEASGHAADKGDQQRAGQKSDQKSQTSVDALGSTRKPGTSPV